ncbi:MAG: Rossmann-like and DUF2520 domain-containing protein [Kosmotogaceae bacterium]
MSFSLIGAGKTGSLFASFLVSKGYKIDYIVDKDPKKARELANYINAGKVSDDNILPLLRETIMIAVKDDEIRNVFESLWNVNKKIDNLIHFSGVLTSEIFKEAAEEKKGVISLHPNLSIKKRFIEPKVLNNTIFGIEGNEKGISFIKAFLEKNGLEYCLIDKSEKNYYHVAAVFASNFTQILALISQRLYEKAGINKKTASKIVREFLEDLKMKNEKEPLENTFTGPAIRKDEQTLRMEHEALKSIDPDLSSLYKLLSELIMKYSSGGD